jgi:hypothetical protein
MKHTACRAHSHSLRPCYYGDSATVAVTVTACLAAILCSLRFSVLEYMLANECCAGLRSAPQRSLTMLLFGSNARVYCRIVTTVTITCARVHRCQRVLAQTCSFTSHEDMSAII